MFGGNNDWLFVCRVDDVIMRVVFDVGVFCNGFFFYGV